MPKTAEVSDDVILKIILENKFQIWNGTTLFREKEEKDPWQNIVEQLSRQGRSISQHNLYMKLKKKQQNFEKV